METEKLRDVTSFVQAGSWAVDERSGSFSVIVLNIKERGMAKGKGLTQETGIPGLKCRKIRKWDASEELVQDKNNEKTILCNA